MNLMLVNLGCGSRYHKAWTNIDFLKSGPDVIQHDLRSGIPLKADSADVVYHSHVLEHFSRQDGLTFLRNCFRILKPGGFIRVVVPDLETIISEYLLQMKSAKEGNIEAAARYDWILLELFDQAVRNFSGGDMLGHWKRNPIPAEEYIIERLGSEVKNALKEIRSQSVVSDKQYSPTILSRIIARSKRYCLRILGYTHEMAEIGKFRKSGEIHYWMYDEYSLKRALLEAGFVNPSRRAADQSAIADFNSYSLDTEIDGSVRKPDSLFVEAMKPL
ncbi:methyltransferase domain-containing protein [Leptospira ellisii]|uniref:Methyltransferase domain-containing protein n=1 Tax=Leptospira ellisii TaxID=2023197 RepID=A0A2N0BGH0_9LEPT|nr:methyltransferase domain-containing protein [Leptospira ellisii]MDV6236892.1 methyltransferase domain-containing protein [Leptospira ellisii]PJZ92568.1 hypothetical protein CH379_12415 [Leptospira ellisii]PKA03095.1 hypothetical protein CH375_19010 [Leptospira ellisii]